MPITLLDSFRSTGTSTSASITTTSGSYQFQLAFVLVSDSASGSTGVTITPPTGWTNLSSFGGGSGSNSVSGVLSYNTATSIPASGTYTWTQPSSKLYTITLARFLDLSTFVGGNGQWQSASNTIVTPTISSGSGNGLLIFGVGQQAPAAAIFSNQKIYNTTTLATLYTPTLITSQQAGTNPGALYNLLYYSIVNMTNTLIAAQVTSDSNQQYVSFLASFNYKASVSSVPSIF